MLTKHVNWIFRGTTMGGKNVQTLIKMPRGKNLSHILLGLQEKNPQSQREFQLLGNVTFNRMCNTLGGSGVVR